MIFFSFDESCTHVHLEGVDFIKVPVEKYDAIYKTLNECNDQYSYVKFVLDTEDGHIVARDDDINSVGKLRRGMLRTYDSYGEGRRRCISEIYEGAVRLIVSKKDGVIVSYKEMITAAFLIMCLNEERM